MTTKGPAIGRGEAKVAVKHSAEAPEKSPLEPRALGAGAIVGWVGLAFLLVGGADFTLTWVPTNFGNPEWEFGTLTASLNGLPVPLFGLAGVFWAGETARRKGVVAFATLCAVCFLLVILYGLVLWATNIPLALQSVPPEIARGLKRALLKTSVQGVVYPLVLAYLARRGWRVLRGKERTV